MGVFFNLESEKMADKEGEEGGEVTTEDPKAEQA